MSDVNVVVDVFEQRDQKPIARISLNGYNITGGFLGSSGAMRSFKVIDGQLWNYWNHQTPLFIRDESGTETRVKIFALPADEGAAGLVEFL